MAKLTTVPAQTFTPIGLGQINQNFNRVEDAIENTLSRDGTSPNQMEADFDLNHHDILNVDQITADRGNFDELYLDGSLFPSGTLDVEEITAEVGNFDVIYLNGSPLPLPDTEDYTPYVNPLDFEGDTIADKIQNAIDAVGDSGGGQVIIPPSWQSGAGAFWEITKAIVPKSNVDIKGIAGTILKIADGVSSPFAIFESLSGVLSNVTISDLILDPNRDGQASDTDQVGAIRLEDNTNGSSNIKIENVEIRNFSFGYHGIHVKGCTGLSVIRCRIHDGGGSNLYHPIYLLRNNEVEVSFNRIWDFNVAQGIKVSGQPAAHSWATIVGNIVKGGGVAQRCINVADFHEVTVTSNILSGSAGAGIRIGTEEEDSATFVVASNVIKDCLYGVRTESADQGSIGNNVIIECWLAGITLRNMHHCAVNGNMIVNLTTAADGTDGLTQIRIENQLNPTNITISGNQMRCSLGSGTRYAIANMDASATTITLGNNGISGTYTQDIFSAVALNQRLRAFGGSLQIDILVKAGAPTTSDIAENTAAICHDSSGGTTVIAANIGGVIKTSELT